MFTKQHYETLASTIRLTWENSNNSDQRATLDRFAQNLCYTFQKDNPQFNRGKFLKAAIPLIYG